jgi:hypothetical protein
MKINYSLLIISGLLLSLYACKKDNYVPGSITGRWVVVSDSTFVGVGINNHPVDYRGQPGDYFDFRTDGKVYTKEGAALDTMAYDLVSDTSIIIGSFGITLNGVPETSHITIFTADRLIIRAPVIATPGGVFGRTISLSR